MFPTILVADKDGIDCVFTTNVIELVWVKQAFGSIVLELDIAKLYTRTSTKSLFTRVCEALAIGLNTISVAVLELPTVYSTIPLILNS